MNRAQRALDNVLNEPAEVVGTAGDLIVDPTVDEEERAIAGWALGRALSELDRVDEACEALVSGIGTAADAGLDELAAEIRVSLSACLLTRGDADQARNQLDMAAPVLSTDAARGRFAIQEGFFALHLGDMDQALVHFSEASGHLIGGTDELARTRLLLNRGVVHTMTGQPQTGEQDFVEAQALATRLGQHMLAAGAAQNLGFGCGRKGDLPGALRWFAKAREAYEQLGSPKRAIGLLESDFSTVLLSGGLYAESAAAAARAAAVAAQTGNRLAQAEAELLIARARLANLEPQAAGQHAATAADIFRRSARKPWAAIAEYVGLNAAAALSRPSVELLDRTAGLIDRLETSGWWREALEARTFAGRVAVQLGQLQEARRHLRIVTARDEDASSALRITGLVASATLNLADGKRETAKADLSQAMELLEDHRATLGSTELRAHASINGAEVAVLGVRLALEDGDPAEVFHWAERWRAGSLEMTGLQADPDSRLAPALIKLRQANAAMIEGTTDPFDSNVDSQIGELEREVRDLARESGAISRRRRRFSLPELQSHLGHELLIEYFVVDGRLHAIRATGSDSSIHDLGELSELERLMHRLTTSLNRLAHHDLTTARPLGPDAIRATADALDECLLRGLDLPPDGGIVVVPTQGLQTMSWAALPSLAERTVTVTPSGWLWVRDDLDVILPGARVSTTAAERQATAGRALLICGPDLPGGQLEIERLAELYDEPIVLLGSDATVAAVLAAMSTVEVAHIAAHGNFRSDNPMLSGLIMHDGPLTVYDLEALPAAPETVVLPACNAARSSVYDGDELLGTAAALLQGGVRSIIAPVTVVPDATVVPDLMVELHTHLMAGRRPAEALVAARASTRAGSGPGDQLIATSFIAIDSRPRR